MNGKNRIKSLCALIHHAKYVCCKCGDSDAKSGWVDARTGLFTCSDCIQKKKKPIKK